MSTDVLVQVQSGAPIDTVHEPAHPEPKSLSPDDLDALYKLLGTNKKVPKHGFS